MTIFVWISGKSHPDFNRIPTDFPLPIPKESFFVAVDWSKGGRQADRSSYPQLMSRVNPDSERII